MSAAVPVENGTTIFTGFAGQACASTAGAIATARTPKTKSSFRLMAPAQESIFAPDARMIFAVLSISTRMKAANSSGEEPKIS